MIVIALDTPTDPQDATDALFVTDNFKAGLLMGQYAKAVMGDKPLKIATLDLAPGITVGILRHNGFIAGKPSGYTDTGVTLITDKAAEGVEGSLDLARRILLLRRARWSGRRG